LIEIFNPFEIEFIRSPIIFVYFNNPIGQIRIVVISILQIILAYYNDKWRYRSIIKIDTLNHNNLFPIVKLYSFNFLTPIVQHYNKDGYNLTYKKACLVEILDIGLYNIIFNNHILKKSKPNPNNLWIFVLDLLIIVQTIPTHTELWLSFDEVGSPTRSNVYCVVYRQQSVDYIFYIMHPKRKSSQIQIKYFLYDYLFF